MAGTKQGIVGVKRYLDQSGDWEGRASTLAGRWTPSHGPGLRAWESVPEREEARARHARGPGRLAIMKMDEATFSRWPSSLGAHMEIEKN